MPAVGLEYRYPLVADFGPLGVHTVSPVIQVIARPSDGREQAVDLAVLELRPVRVDVEHVAAQVGEGLPDLPELPWWRISARSAFTRCRR
jgi:hypothetical protein